ncbi:chaperonin 10-like protein [Apodospora peruviana]|uniref:Chaperonin 10-like protein n=1 Tax=Apodospora peruviana TaxID=516989 RepID=A0AAE0I3U5_9PEZI|nr:chaperonin 10-like protein [Apodospora peruviana]
MKALVYTQTVPIPKITNPTDAVVRVTKTTLCGTDLHIRKGDVASCTPGHILGHEGVGVVHEVGTSVSRFKKGDAVLISCISSCATCEYCRRGVPSQCTTGGWILGNEIDGTQAEYVRIPHADCSLYALPQGVDEASLIMLSDIFPTGLECGVLNGRVQPGSTVAIIGAGPVGLAALVTAQFYSPAKIIVLDADINRLMVASQMGAHDIVMSGTHGSTEGTVIRDVLGLTDGKGCDTVIEAVGIPATFKLAQRLLAPVGVLANVGVHGSKVDLFLDELWSKNITITTRLVDAVTTPMLLKMVEADKLRPKQLITHAFRFNDIEKAYQVFGAAQEHKALKVLIQM